MINIIKLVEILNKTKWWLISLLFIFFIINTFSNEIKRFIDLKFSEKDIVVNSINDDILIEDALNDLMISSGADRAYIFRFHNGVTYYNGSHKSKMSCDYEVVSLGISKEAQRLQDIPTGLYVSWLKNVIEYKMFIFDIEEIEDVRTKITLRNQGVSGLKVAPYYRDGKIFALIGVDFVKEIPKEKKEYFYMNRQFEINKFKVKVKEIGDLLN